MVEVAVIGTPCVARVEQSIGCCLRAALSCRALALEQLDVVAVALQRHGLADENVAAALGCRLRLGQRYRAAVGELDRSEEHTSELQSLMRISYAVFCLKKKQKQNKATPTTRN